MYEYFKSFIPFRLYVNIRSAMLKNSTNDNLQFSKLQLDKLESYWT